LLQSFGLTGSKAAVAAVTTLLVVVMVVGVLEPDVDEIVDDEDLVIMFLPLPLLLPSSSDLLSSRTSYSLRMRMSSFSLASCRSISMSICFFCLAQFGQGVEDEAPNKHATSSSRFSRLLLLLFVVVTLLLFTFLPPSNFARDLYEDDYH
jgi:hypothetical protein